jgi:hypothetical protein
VNRRPLDGRRTTLVVGLSLLAGSPAPRAAAAQTFTGIVSDEMCATAGHEKMQMGPTDAECTRACVALHGAAYVLVDRTAIYVLSDSKAADRFAGQRVRVTGVLDEKTKTIRVETIAAA